MCSSDSHVQLLAKKTWQKLRCQCAEAIVQGMLGYWTYYFGCSHFLPLSFHLLCQRTQTLVFPSVILLDTKQI